MVFSGWWALSLLFGELIILFALSRSLTVSLSKLIYRVSKSQRFTVGVLAVLFLPGTIIHEISHFIAAGLLFVPTGNIEIFPEVDGDHVRLGSAEIGQTDMLRRIIIGMAPLFIGLSIIFSVLWIVQGGLLGTAAIWEKVLALYVIFEVGNSMFSSKKDLEGAYAFFGAIIFVVILIFGILYLTNNIPSFGWLNRFNFFGIVEFIKKASIFLLVPLIINSGLLIIIKLLSLGLKKAF